MLKTALQDVGRLSSIAAIVAQHGFHQIAEAIRRGHQDGRRIGLPPPSGMPRRLRLLLQDLGPTFVKLGQVLSTRPDILPSSFTDELKLLQDQVAPVEFSAITKDLEERLGRPPEEIFAHIEPTPMAAASIAQIHRGTLRDGRAVVLKIQRPGIEKTIRADLDLLYVLARILDATTEESILWHPVEIVKEFERSIFEELDFLREARNIEEFRRNFAETPGVRFPQVIEEATSRTLLCLEYLDGVKITEIDRERQDVHKIVQTLLDAIFQMVYVDGYFHGDPHPGNILVQPDGTLVFLDVGLVGRLSRGVQDLLIQLSLAIAMKDAENAARTIYRLGTPADRVNLIQFRDEIESLMARHMSGRLSDVNAGNLMRELFDLAIRHKIRVQTDCALLVKAAVTLDGVVRSLAPDLEIETTVAPYRRRLLFSRYGLKSVGETAAKGLLGLVGSLREFPLQVDQIVSDLQSGRLTVQMRNKEIDRLGRSLNDLGTKVFLGLLVCGLLVAAGVLLAPYRWEVDGLPVWPILGAAGAGLLFAVVLWWHVFYGRARKIRLAFWLALFRRRK
ncbi:MAG: AarF/ABC1/UbiB kinase family protein [Planctomycetes bacterium]|nr:AarF/ABC1/UbiB kinase family protein [Planctomycetota bacterium]